MARQGRRSRVFGPYAHRRRWRIFVVDERGEKNSHFYDSEAEALQVKRSLLRAFAQQVMVTLNEALEKYELYMRIEKGNKTSSCATTATVVRSFFPDLALRVSELDPKKCAGYYDELSQRVSKRTGKRLAVDTHRNTLAQAKTFLGWCVKRKWLAKNPLEHVEGRGKRRHGKPQLRINEARAWLAKAVELADQGKDGPVAAMMTLLMGLRASEVITRVIRDLDDDGWLLWIPETKTDAGRRRLQVPALLQPYLLHLTKDRPPEARIFPGHRRDWPRAHVKAICRLAGVPTVTAHGMRGLHSTLAVDSGVTGHMVASALGHESEKTTFQSYAQPEAVAGAQQRRVLSVLSGGRK